jgi:hypothetical protein
MANITLDVLNTGEQIPVTDIDLDSVTNTELIYSAIKYGIIPSELYGNMPKLKNKNNMPITETATLATLGFVDGDTIHIVIKCYT